MGIFYLAILVIGFLLYKQYGQQFLNQGKAGKIKLALIALGVIFLIAALSGRASPLFALIGAFLTQIMRIAPLLVKMAPFLSRYLGPAGLGGFGGAHARPGGSAVNTPSLSVTLDHATGRIDGQIRQGEFNGRTLSSLTDDELSRFVQYCQQHDNEAMRLLMAYVQRERSAWYESAQRGGAGGAGGGAPPAIQGTVTVDEAYDILGLQPGATREEIVGAHRQLMSKFHPDKGGSNYLATRINAAKEVLLDQVKRQGQ